ncbi:MAG: DnaJ domain-containing protein [Saccharospirillaceae bacterium]|nr:DnaJ domain-containing protein [Saccharospirillaceae bacterium]
MKPIDSSDDQNHQAPDQQQALGDLDVIRQLLASYLSDSKRSSVYELVKWLQQPEQAIFNEDALKDALMLFRCNFFIMHALYQLRNHWLSLGVGELLISALHVQLVRQSPEQKTAEQHSAISSNSRDLDCADPLQAYYLDLNNLSTSREEVERLMEQFWKKMARPDYSSHQDDDLATLELKPPVSAREVRQQYRRLAMKHHPDRGGDSLRFRQINAAFQRLKQAPFYH